MSILKVVQYTIVDVCIEFYNWWQKSGTIYCHSKFGIVTIGSDNFLLKKDDALISTVRRAVQEHIKVDKQRK